MGSKNITFAFVMCVDYSLHIKRKDVLNFLKQQRCSIYFLQDTHFTKSEENNVRAQWGYECFYFSTFSSQQRGVAIFFNNNFEYKLHSQYPDNEGFR